MPLLSEYVSNSKSYFHPGIENNFCRIFIPLTDNIEEYQQEIARSTQPLNDADLDLLLVCKKILGTDKHRSIYNWAKVIHDKTNLLAIYHAEELIQYLEKNVIHTTINNYLKRNHPKVLTKFLEIPENLFKINRINFYCSFEDSYSLFNKISEKCFTDPIFSKLINRIEIAKENLQNPDKNKHFPKLIFVLNDVDLVRDKAVMNSFLTRVGSITSEISQQAVNAEFAWPWGSCATLTQGYKLYKRYLKLLGLLDKVYSAKHDYAFLQSDKDFWYDLLKEV